MKLKIYDEDGFLSIVNTDRYSTFVDEDWTLEQLLAHFVSEMNKLNCVVWQTDRHGGDLWTVKILEAPSDEPSFREFSHEIEVTDGRLYIVDYTDLTMAAQFEDDTLPRKDHADRCIELKNGLYRMMVSQMFDPDSPERYDLEELVFEVIPVRIPQSGNDKTEQVVWYNDGRA